MIVTNLERPVADWSDVEVFTHVVEHLLTMPSRCGVEVHGEFVGRYHRVDDMGFCHACPVGCLIPRALYADSCEDGAIRVIAAGEDVWDRRWRVWLFPKDPQAFDRRLRLLEALQDIHDNTRRDKCKAKLRELRTQFGL